MQHGGVDGGREGQSYGGISAKNESINLITEVRNMSLHRARLCLIKLLYNTLFILDMVMSII